MELMRVGESILKLIGSAFWRQGPVVVVLWTFMFAWYCWWGEVTNYQSKAYNPGITGFLFGYEYGWRWQNLQEYLGIMCLIAVGIYPILWHQRRRGWMAFALFTIIFGFVYCSLPTF